MFIEQVRKDLYESIIANFGEFAEGKTENSERDEHLNAVKFKAENSQVLKRYHCHNKDMYMIKTHTENLII